MNKNRFESCSMIMTGILFFILGIFVIMDRKTFIYNVIELVSMLTILAGFIQIYSKFDGRTSTSLIEALITIVVGTFILFFPSIPVSVIVLTFGIYAIATGIIKLITYTIYHKDHVQGRWILFLDAIVFLTTGIGLVATPIAKVGQLFTFLGCYAIGLGYMYIRDGLDIILPKEASGKLKRRIRINLPIFLVAMLPYKSLQKINHYLQDKDKEEDLDDLDPIDLNEKPDMGVLIHVTNDGFGVLGHVDLCIDGKVISYGNYDHDSWRLHEMVGDGILFTTSKEKYVPFCIAHSKKTLFCYGIKLNEQQKESVQKKLKEIEDRLIPWQPPAAYDKEHLENYQDYASLLLTKTQAKLYKFKYSRFKTYFVLSTNCVLLADSVLGKAGTDLLNINGLITPGTYYDYFEREYKKKDGFVISKKVYQ